MLAACDAAVPGAPTCLAGAQKVCPPRRARVHDALRRCAPLIQVLAVLDPRALQHLQQNIAADLNNLLRRDVRAAAAELRRGAAADVEASSKAGGGDYNLAKERSSLTATAGSRSVCAVLQQSTQDCAAVSIVLTALPKWILFPMLHSPQPAAAQWNMPSVVVLRCCCCCACSKRLPRMSIGSGSGGGSDSVSDWTADPTDFTGPAAGSSAAKRAAFLDGEFTCLHDVFVACKGHLSVLEVVFDGSLLVASGQQVLTRRLVRKRSCHSRTSCTLRVSLRCH